MCIASVEGDFQMGFVRHTFFRGYDKRLTSAFISNQHPRYFLEISFNSCLIRLDQLSMACTGKIPQKICFKYNIFDTIRRVFFRGSMASNISLGLDAGSPSSSFGWSSFFFSIFLFWERGLLLFVFYCLFLFTIFLSLRFVFPLFLLLPYIWSSQGFVIHVFLIIRYDQPWLGMATYD